MKHPLSHLMLMALVATAAPGIAAAQTPASAAAAPAGEVAAKEGAAGKKPPTVDKAGEPEFKAAHKESAKGEAKADDKKQQATVIVP